MGLLCWGLCTNNDYEIIEDYRHFQGDMINLKLYAYDKRTCFQRLLFHLVAIFMGGLPYLLLWSHRLRTLILYRKTALTTGHYLLVVDSDHSRQIVRIKTESCSLPFLCDPIVRYFIHNHTKYFWVASIEHFVEWHQFVPSASIEHQLLDDKPVLDIEHAELRRLCGENRIDVHVKSYWQLFCDEVFNPFYVFQVFSIVLWCFDSYQLYASCVLVLTLFSAVTALLQTRKQSVALHDLVESSKCKAVRVQRRNLHDDIVEVDVDPTDLVPGDLIVVPKADFLMPCDCLLLTGQCIVNESMLTGESMPVTKTAPHPCDEMYAPDTHKRYTLFCGTHVIQSRYYGGEKVVARVVRIGFDTTKGALVKSILYPAPVGLQFYTDSLKFVAFLFCVALFGTAYCLYLYIIRGAEVGEILLRSLDIVTIVVPPALPAAMTVGIVYSQSRLKRMGVFCISPPRINVAGRIKLACFDKTGTLTHEGLDMYAVLPCSDADFDRMIRQGEQIDQKLKIVQAMATCHSLTQICGELNGDPLDLSMFRFTKWRLEEAGDDENTRFDMLAPSVVKAPESTVHHACEIGILKQFPFSSSLQCMSVICRNLKTPHMEVFTKGAPEKVSGMCLPSTLPPNFTRILSYYTTKGYRVIAMAHKDLPVNFKWVDAHKVKRDLIECDLIFLGLLILQNPLKSETAPAINVLHSANIRTIMITGDNILTAISVARDCGMVGANEQICILDLLNSNVHESTFPLFTVDEDSHRSRYRNEQRCHIAIDGKSWAQVLNLYPHLLPSLLVGTTIFARFQPDQKTQLITHLQSLDYVVAMVGDGANDCGALKAAHVGVSLSQAEASVAAPFTSSIQNISCIIHLMLEGRCALVTSFAIFKYMALYSLIQFFTVLLLYRQNSILGDTQFLYIDLVITTSLAVTIGRQGPAGILHRKRPIGSLVSPHVLIPMALQIILCGMVQIAVLIYLMHQDWYHPIDNKGHHTDAKVLCWENTVLFAVTCFQYVILASVYSKGPPFRRSIFTNAIFMVVATVLTAFNIYLMVAPTGVITDFFQLMPSVAMDHHKVVFRYSLLLWPVVHFLAALLVENCCANTVWLKSTIRFLRRKHRAKSQYKLLSSPVDIGHNDEMRCLIDANFITVE